MSDTFVIGLLVAAGMAIGWLHHHADQGQVELVLAFALAPVDTWAGMIAVLLVAVAVLVGFLFWSHRTMPASFFRGALAGVGLVMSFDIVWVHWIFGLHHVTNTRMDVVLEPLFVILGLVFLWFGITRERRQAPGGKA